MDLKSMLNDAAAQRAPRLHTPQSSYDAQSAATHDSVANRSSPYPPPLQQTNSRSPTGGYFAVQSPHQPHLTSLASSAGTPVYAQSPGPHPPGYAPLREASGPHHHPQNNASVPRSPSVSTLTSVHPPPTPGGAHQYSNHNHTPGSTSSQPGQHTSYTHPQSPHSSVTPLHQATLPPRQVSPHAQPSQHHPATPLGPPIAYNKASPQAQRPTSQGIDQNYRRSSYGSVGSAQSREHNHGPLGPEQMRASHGSRQSHPDVDRARERDRSVSVSPKTIPKPSPYRQSSSTSVNSVHHPTLASAGDSRATQASYVQDRLAETAHPVSSQQSSTTSAEADEPLRGPLMGTTTGPVGPPQPNTRGMSSPSSREPNHSHAVPPPTLKRNASFMSDGAQAAQQPRKRLRGHEVPLFAQSARKRPPKFGHGSKKARFASAQSAPAPSVPVQPVQPVQSKATTESPTNGHPMVEPTTAPQPVANEMKWEPTIANVVPADDLCTGISRWIHSYIGNRVPPAGAVFEIEAKIGAIWDTQMGERIRLPVRSEAITAVGLPHVKFESSMDMEQHRQLNEYLNNLAQAAWNDPARESVRPRHLRQYDDFFELTPEGLSRLDPALLAGKNRRPRVRKTTDKETGQVREMIVKARIDDLEVYNPVHDFDFRISISIESNWEGDPAWLIPIQNANARTRLKDRMSYRHGAIQVDLTQVSHEDSPRMEHELEVEVSVAMLQAELEKERLGMASRFNDLVKSLVDNARLLCRHGSLYRSGPR